MAFEDSNGERFSYAEQPYREFDLEGRGTLYNEHRFVLTPETGPAQTHLVVEEVLTRDRYTAGDWFDLPLPVYLVFDAECASVFRVIVHRDWIGLDVLPRTTRAALAAFHDTLEGTSGITWLISRPTYGSDESARSSSS